MKTLDLDELLGNEHEQATFHDAVLEDLSVSYAGRRAEFRFRIPVGLHKGDLAYRRGVLTLSDLQFLIIEPPATPYQDVNPAGAWITSDGPLPDPAVQLSVALPAVPEDSFIHYFFASDWNSFIVIGGRSAAFAWIE